MTVESHSIQETQSFAITLAKKIPLGSVVALIGNLGTGKTTFTQGFAQGLGIEERVGSPTFKLVSEYDGAPHKLYHIDAYRLDSIDDFFNIGGEFFLDPDDGVTLIEWADIIQEGLPHSVITIRFSRIQGIEESRKIEITGLPNA